jgi:hypothetical protein
MYTNEPPCVPNTEMVWHHPDNFPNKRDEERAIIESLSSWFRDKRIVRCIYVGTFDQLFLLAEDGSNVGISTGGLSVDFDMKLPERLL